MGRLAETGIRQMGAGQTDTLSLFNVFNKPDCRRRVALSDRAFPFGERQRGTT
jgi:hypothetical protein